MASTYLHKNQGSPTNAYKFTYSVWLKRSKLGVSQRFYQGYESGNNRLYAMMTANDTIFCYGVTGGNVQINLETTRKFKDTSSWYNVVLKGDSTLGTSTDRFQVWVNGVRETSLTIASNINQNTAFGNLVAQSNNTLTISGQETHNELWDGSMSHIHFTDGYAYDASAFGETDTTTGEWKGKTSPSVTYGNTGYFILKDGNGITDQSGEGNNFTLGGGTLTDLKDNPDNVFATWNRLAKLNTTISLIYGNTTSSTTTGTWKSLTGTIGASTGKYYFEGKTEVSNYGVLGIVNDKLINSTTDGGFAFTNKWSYGYKMYNGTLVYYEGDGGGNQSSYGSTLSTGQVLGVAVDLDNSKLYFSINGVWQNSGDPTSGATGTGAFSIQSGETYVPAISQLASSGNPMLHLNCGNGYFGTTAVATNSGNGYSGAEGSSIFNYQPPTGYSALSTKGLNT